MNIKNLVPTCILCVSFCLPATAAIVHVPDKQFTIMERSGESREILFGGGGVLGVSDSAIDAFAIEPVPGHQHHTILAQRVTPANLKMDAVIGEAQSWNFLPGFLVSYEIGEGEFFNTTGFVAVRRVLDENEFIYGWIRVSHSADDQMLTVHDWAWNSEPNQPILAGEVPEPRVYGLLAGIAALLFVVARRNFYFRRERSGSTT